MAEDTTGTQQDDTAVVASETTASTQPAVEANTAQPEAAPTQEGDSQKEAPEGLLSKAEDSADAQEETVPESYESFEGTHLDEQANEDLSALAKDKQLTQSQANLVAEGYNKAMESLLAANNTTIEESHKAFEADKNGQENLLLAKKALDKMGATEWFAEKGYDHDYELIKVMASYGKLLSEDQIVTGQTSSPAQPQHPYGSEWK